MVLPKSTVHVSRIAGTALKSFTHGYAQTVVAASQSSYASQNTSVTPLASNFLNRFKDAPSKPGQHVHFSTSAAGQQGADAVTAKQEGQDAGLAHYHEAWQKHHKVESRDRHHLPLAKRIGWKPPTTIPETQKGNLHTVAAQDDHTTGSDVERSNLKRSYSTSAVDNFAKAINNEEAEAIAIAQVNESINEDVTRARKDSPLEDVVSLKDTSPAISAPEAAQVDEYTTELTRLVGEKQYAQIPVVFEAMLRSGVASPSQAAYQALLTSALHVTSGRHHKVPRILDIYSDMMRRSIVPDGKTLSIIVEALATRALEAATASVTLSEKQARNGYMASVFTLNELEHRIMSEDQALEIALRFLGAPAASMALPVDVTADLVHACATRGKTAEMASLFSTLRHSGASAPTSIYPAVIAAFGQTGDLRQAVNSFDHYREMAIANNTGANDMKRIDTSVYCALVKAYGECGNLDGGKRLLARVDRDERASNAAIRSRGTVVTTTILPLEVKAGNFDNVYEIVNALPSQLYSAGLQVIVKTAADLDNVSESTKAFDGLLEINATKVDSVSAMFAMHVRLRDVEAGERYWRILEQSPASQDIMELSTMRALSFISLGQVSRGLGPVRNVFAGYRKASATDSQIAIDAKERMEEDIEAIAKSVVAGGPVLSTPEVSAELMRLMEDNTTLLSPLVDSLLSALTVEQIGSMAVADLDTITRLQARQLCSGASRDVAGPARFACLLENIAVRAILPDVGTENAIESALVSLGRPELKQLWGSYRYPTAASVGSGPTASAPSTFASFSPTSNATPPSLYEDSFDPYLAQTDHKGSVVITDILEKPHGRPAVVLGEAMTKFRNIRRAGRHPRFFAYGKLIQAAARANQLETGREVLEMAKQDVPYLPQYRIVRHGWIALLDSMVAACVTTGRRGLAAQYHQDLLDMGSAPSANTFGLYITSLKETTKTFDEASEAVKIFLRSKTEGVEPTSFLYNALIGKLGKARRIDDCLFYFAEMRQLGIRPTSVTYGTIVNALCRVSDEKFAEEIFEEMETCGNYKPRPAPYHSLMQFFLTTKRDRSKVLAYYERMRMQGIEPTMHTFKLLIDAHATLGPVDMPAAEAVLNQMRAAGVMPEAVHFAALIHAKGCVQQDVDGARALFNSVVADPAVRVQSCVYQAMFESLVANKRVGECEALLADMRRRGVELTAYIANALIHGYTLEKDLVKAKAAFGMLGRGQREPSTYEAMVRACLAVEDRQGAEAVVGEALGRGYPSAVAGKIAELIGGGRA